MSYLNIHGWFDFEALYTEVVATAQADDILVEVGVWCGKSVVFLAQRAEMSGKALRIFAVDTWQGSTPCEDVALVGKDGNLWRTFLENIRVNGVNHVITPMCLPSVQAAAYFVDASAHMVFIDAEHVYESVRNDILAWRPKVKPGGWLAGHDWESDEVKRAVREVLGEPTLHGSCWTFRV